MSVIDIKFKKNQDPEFDIEKEQLYDSTYYEYVMNVSKQLTPAQHACVVASICPTLSAKFCELYHKRSELLINSYLQIKPEEKSFLDKMPEMATAVNYVFKYYFQLIQEDFKNLSVPEALDKNQEFYFACESIFLTLPASYPFSIIDLVESMK